MFVVDVGNVLNKCEGKLLILGFVLFPIINDKQKRMEISNNDEFLVSKEDPRK